MPVCVPQKAEPDNAERGIIRSLPDLLKRLPGAYFDCNMSQPKCSICGADLLPEVNFCRQCGAAASNSSELPTAMFNQSPEDTSTRRLDSRVTSPESRFHGTPASAVDVQPAPQARKTRWTPLVVIGIVLITSMCVLAWVTLIRPVRHARIIAAADSPFFYPGSTTVVDAPTTEGRAMHLQTGDSFEKVVAWYTAKLKPSKTMQLTQNIMVLRGGNVTATIAVEGDKTNILIKELNP